MRDSREGRDVVQSVLRGDPRQPRDPASERFVLAGMLHSPEVVEYVHERLAADDFWLPLHNRLARVIFAEYLAGRATDHLAITSRCVDLGLGEQLGASVIHELMTDLPLVLGSLPLHVDRVREMTERRNVLTVAVRTALSALEDHETPPAALAHLASGHLERAVRLTVSLAHKPRTLQEYLDQEIKHDWLVPGLIETRERVLVTASEGLGKSVLLRQLAVCTASGIDPFTDEVGLPPRRVLVIDCENPVRLNQSRYRPLAMRARQLSQWPDGLYVESPGRNLDLTRPRDQALVLHQVRTTEPELLIIGPIYKLHNGSPEEETPARAVIDFIDRLIDKYGCAVMMEAHTPWGQAGARRPLRPIGSTIWARWPDFGIGLRAVTENGRIRSDRLCEVEQWKYRDERRWPAGLRGGGTWPWVPVDEVELDEGRRA